MRRLRVRGHSMRYSSRFLVRPATQLQHSFPLKSCSEVLTYNCETSVSGKRSRHSLFRAAFNSTCCRQGSFNCVPPIRALRTVRGIRLSPGSWHRHTRGLFESEYGRRRSRPPVSASIPRRLRFELSVFGEPRLRPLFLKFANADFQAKITPRNALKLTSPTGQIELPFGDRGALAQIDFDVPEGSEPSSTTLNGKFVARTAAGPERFEFANLPDAKGVSRRRGGVTVTVESVDIHRMQTNSNASITIIVAYDTGGPAFESHRSWFFQNEAWIETSDKQRVEMNEPPRTSRQSDGAITVDYEFHDLPLDTAKCRFNYVAPTLLIDVPVGFEFKDVPVASGSKPSTP